MKKEFILVVILALVLVSSALVPLTDTALAQSGNPNRSFSPDDQLLTDESFDVIVTFTAPADGFNSIGLGDSVPAGSAIQVDTNWCTPNAYFSNIVGNEAQYVWIGPYNSGQVFTAIYRVTVPSDASLGTYLFDGKLNYFIAASGLFSEDIGGDPDVTVTVAANPHRGVDVNITSTSNSDGTYDLAGTVSWNGIGVWKYLIMWEEQSLSGGPYTKIGTPQQTVSFDVRTSDFSVEAPMVTVEDCYYRYKLTVFLYDKKGRTLNKYPNGYDQVEISCDSTQ